MSSECVILAVDRHASKKDTEGKRGGCQSQQQWCPTSCSHIGGLDGSRQKDAGSRPVCSPRGNPSHPRSEVARACERPCSVPCNIWDAKKRASAQKAAEENAICIPEQEEAK